MLNIWSLRIVWESAKKMNPYLLKVPERLPGVSVGFMVVLRVLVPLSEPKTLESTCDPLGPVYL